MLLLSINFGLYDLESINRVMTFENEKFSLLVRYGMYLGLST